MQNPSFLSSLAFTFDKSQSKIHPPIEFYNAIFRPLKLYVASFCLEIVKGILILMGKTLIFIVLNFENFKFDDKEISQ